MLIALRSRSKRERPLLINEGCSPFAVLKIGIKMGKSENSVRNLVRFTEYNGDKF